MLGSRFVKCGEVRYKRRYLENKLLAGDDSWKYILILLKV